jgi:hypothetical protein
MIESEAPISAHAWLDLEGMTLIGADARREFTVLSAFTTCPSSTLV